MAEPSKKSEPMNYLLDKISKSMYGIPRRVAILTDQCVMCGAACPQNSFRDEISRKEYAISGMCQQCQDKIFDKDED